MTDSIIENYNQLREQVIKNDRRFQQKEGHLCFEGGCVSTQVSYPVLCVL